MNLRPLSNRSAPIWTPLKDEHGDDEGLLSEVIDNDKITKANVQKRIKEIKDSADDADELAVLKQCLALFEKEAAAKKAIKEAEADLERKLIKKYPAFSQEEVQTLVVECKWLDELSDRASAEVDRLSQRLAGRVKELAERYAEQLPLIEAEVEALKGKVQGHLARMGFTLN